MSIFLKTVDFGLAKTGLSTVGYTLYDGTGAEHTARSTSGVFEIGSTGMYGARINFPDKEEVILLWDTGETPARYSRDTSLVQLNTIQEETDKIRVIWNTLKNTGDLYSKLLERLDKVKTLNNRKDFNDVIAEIKKIIIPAIPKIPTLEEIKGALSVNIEPPVVNIAKPEIPDYSEKIEKIRELIISLSLSVNRLAPDYSEKINSLSSLLSRVQSAVNTIYSSVSDKKDVNSIKSTSLSLVSMMQDLKQELKNAQEALNQAIIENTKLDKTVKDLVTATSVSKMIELMSESNKEEKKQKEALRIALGIK